MMYSTTFRQHSVTSRTLEAMADAIARGFVQLQSLFSLAPAAPTPAEARAQLLQMADAYESSQPSYAADLRAAASRH
ncbi:MAG: hypothetical protein KIT35_13520 [Piscinibacter sp.]|uniref:hypothetical protein n=1 Tax=Piscinibacter TaxID=1114981 RepID=UPI000FDCEDBF|nr:MULTISPECIES: hypothetical protein [Piscinibacter]MCW5664850.1 hypothetical protein [Piscinibacter sp.]